MLILLLIIATVIYLFTPFSKLQALRKQESRTISYTVEVEGVDMELFKEKIKEGETVIDSVSKNTMGVVYNVDGNTEYSELQYRPQTNKEIGVLATYDDKINLKITISVSADYVKGEGYSVNGTRIAVGEKLSLRFPNYVCEGYCIDLEQE